MCGGGIRIETLRSIVSSIQKDFLAPVDLSLFGSLMCFGDGLHFQYQALTFGLKSAPRVFTKVLVPLMAYLSTQSSHLSIHGQLVDQFPVGQGGRGEDVQKIVACLQDHSFIINKSSLSPSQRVLHLWVVIDTIQDKVSQERRS